MMSYSNSLLAKGDEQPNQTGPQHFGLALQVGKDLLK
jgi:hypothetical protein